MSYTVHVGREELDALRPTWGVLVERCPAHVFQTSAFVSAWTDTVGIATKATPLVVTRERNGELVGILPAVIVRYGPVQLLTWLGGPYVLDYGDVIFDSSASDIPAEQFVHEALILARKAAPGAFVYLTNVRDEAVCRPALEASMRVYKHGVAPYLDLVDTFDEYIHSLPRSRRHNLTRIVNKLDRMGTVAFETVHAGEPGFSDLMDTITDYQRRRFAGRKGNAPIFDDSYHDFRVEHARRDPSVFAAKLSVGGEFVAASLQCVYRGRMYYLIGVFDDRFAEVGPGKIHMRYLLEHCYRHGLDVFDFCWGAESYKYLWTDQDAELSTYVGNDIAGRALSTLATLHRQMVGSSVGEQ